MKKYFVSFLLIFLSIFFNLFLHIEASADTLKYQENTVSKTKLTENLEHIQADSIVINDSGISTYQHVNVVVKQNDANQIQIANWSKFSSTGKLTLATVKDIAIDFELKNPGYKVLAAVNGDYFAYPPTSINSNINFNGDIIKAQNHTKYQALMFNQFGQNVTVNKSMKYGDYYLTVYHPTTKQILAVRKIQGLNSKILGEAQTTIYYNNNTMNLENAEKYVVEVPTSISFVDSHLLAKGQISYHTTDNIEVGDGEFVIVTNDETVKTLLNQKPVVRVQKMVYEEINNTNNAIGIDSQILKDGLVRTFESIGGQSLSNTTSRHPRTSIGFSDDGDIIIATVDGRQSEGAAGVVSYGVDLRELASVMKAYGSANAYNLDGGGSSQMVIRNDENQLVVINSPSEGPHFPKEHSYYRDYYRVVANAILFVVPDISVNTTYFDFTKDSLELAYEISKEVNVKIESMDLYVNGEIKPLIQLEDQLVLNNLLENSFNSFSFLFTYKKNNETVTQTFSNNIINLSIDSGVREPLLPRNFSIDFENIENTNNFKVIINYEDSDNIVTKISVLRKDNNQKITAITQYQGCKIATIENAEDGKTYEFSVIYYYNGISDFKELETTYTYLYKTNDNDDNVNNENNVDDEDDSSLLPEIMIAIVITGGVGYIIYRMKRGRKNGK